MPAETQPTRAATIYDVADAAGVSAATVSRVFARPGRVSLATAERVRKAANDVGYQSIQATRPMAPSPQRHGTIALVVADISNPVYFELIRGAEEEAAQNGYTMLLAHTRESGALERAALERSLDVVDGVVLSSSRMSETEIRTIARQKPTVIINRAVKGVPSIYVDQISGAQQVMTQLHKLGHTSVVYLAGPDASWANGIRWQAIREYGSRNAIQTRMIHSTAPTMEAGAALAEAVRASGAGAVIAFNDMLALGLMRALQQAGVRIPAEISVVGFDNSTGASLVEPGLTSVASPQHTLGATAVRTLLALSAHGSARPTEDHSVRLPSRLVLRGSAGRRG